MNPTLDLLAVVLQLAIPLALIVRVAFTRYRGVVALVLEAAVAGVYVVAIALAGLWMALPLSMPLLYGILLMAALWRAVRRMDRSGPERAVSPIGVAVRAGLLLALAVLVVRAVSGRQPLDGTPVALSLPLEGAHWLVGAGGGDPLLNPHLKTVQAEQFRDYTGQSYAVDLVAEGAWGSRTTVLPTELGDYAAFGRAILAPCSGRVVVARDGQADLLPAGTEPESLPGNHVILACSEIWVLLAHMRQGSVAVAPGDSVRVGQTLGQVGNSGRSDEPHLHIHAQTPGTEAAPLGGSPLPMTFDGRQLVRNDRVHGLEQQAARSLEPEAGPSGGPDSLHD